ncbi:unnamed protein product [Calypogeia fissa]
MGNTMGKKKKLGNASSAKWVSPAAEVQQAQSKKDALSPLGRSYSMPVHHAKPKSDNYHVVALTSSTYGILKVDLPKKGDAGGGERTNEELDRRTAIARGRSLGGEPGGALEINFNEFQEKLKQFDVPGVMVPRPWSEMDEIVTKLKAPGTEGNRKVRQGGLEGLKAVKEEEPETINMWELMEGLDDDSRSPLAGAVQPLPGSPHTPKPGTVAKKVRNLETSLSFSSVHTVTDLDADFLEGAARTELQTAYETDTLVKGTCYSHQSPSRTPIGALGRSNTTTGGFARHGTGKENAPLSPAVQRDLSFSTLTPVKLNSPSANVLQSGFVDSKGNNNSNHIRSTTGIFGSTPNIPNKVAGGGGGGVVVESPKTPVKAIIENFGKVASNGSKFNHNSPSPLLDISPRGIVSRSTLSPRIAVQHTRLENDSNTTGPSGFPTSSSDDSEVDQQQVPPDSPLFDPELLASFEKAIEDVSEDEWYRVRRSDAGVASTSGSSSDGDSPLRGNAPGVVNGYSTNNKTSTHLPQASPLARNKKPDSTDPAFSRKMSSKVAPVDFRDVVLQKVANKADPFDRFEEKCPPGGEGRVVVYVTSLRGIRKTFEDCSHMKLVVMGYRVAVDERDVSMHSDFRLELKDLLGKPMPVPRLFIKGRYIGGAEEVSLLHEDGTLANLLETLPKQTSWEPCDGCGDHRFVPCSDCSGSCKVVNEDDQVVKCTECNENGLVRCPMCF